MPEYGLANIRIFSNKHVLTRQQVRFPRSKKKRICKKWSKDERNFALMPGMIWLNGEYIAHPDIIEKLRKYLSIIETG